MTRALRRPPARWRRERCRGGRVAVQSLAPCAPSSAENRQSTEQGPRPSAYTRGSCGQHAPNAHWSAHRDATGQGGWSVLRRPGWGVGRPYAGQSLPAAVSGLRRSCMRWPICRGDTLACTGAVPPRIRGGAGSRRRDLAASPQAATLECLRNRGKACVWALANDVVLRPRAQPSRAHVRFTVRTVPSSSAKAG